MKRRFEALSVPDFMLAVCEKLSLAIKVAEDAVKRSTGLFMEPIWQYYQSANIIVTDELAGALDANTGSLPPGESSSLFVTLATDNLAIQILPSYMWTWLSRLPAKALLAIWFCFTVSEM